MKKSSMVALSIAALTAATVAFPAAAASSTTAATMSKCGAK